jgi:type IV pilus assembly protein PilC
MMFDAGIPLYRSAAVLAQGREYSLLVDAKLKKVPADLEQGRTLSKALERTGLFTPMIVNSVRLGEQSGRLVSILNALSDTEERGVQLTRALISRLTYPAVVMLAMSGGLLVLGHVMSRAMASMPSLQKSYSPMLAAVSSMFQNRAFLPLLLLSLALAIVAARRIWRIHRIRLGFERALLVSPIVGPLLRRLEANSVTSHLALLSKAGFPLDKGLGLCADLVRTLSFRRALLLSQQELRNGDELTSSMKRAELFPQDVLALVQAGEVAGSLERSLDTAARYCAEQVERTLESVLAVVEPLLIGLMGIAIGTVLILTFVPIFSTLQDL